MAPGSSRGSASAISAEAVESRSPHVDGTRKEVLRNGDGMTSRTVWVTLLSVSCAVGCGALARCSPKREQQKPAVPVAPMSQHTAGQFEVAEVILDKKLMPGWDDWGWGPHEYKEEGARIGFGGFGGIILHHPELPSTFGG